MESKHDSLMRCRKAGSNPPLAIKYFATNRVTEIDPNALQEALKQNASLYNSEISQADLVRAVKEVVAAMDDNPNPPWKKKKKKKKSRRSNKIC